MIQVTKEFIKTMIGRQHVIFITKMILAELTRGIAVRFQQTGNGGVFFLHPQLCARQSHLGKTRAIHALTHDVE